MEQLLERYTSGNHGKSRQAAEQLYTDDWEAFIMHKYGTKLSVTYYNSPVNVDNLVSQIIMETEGGRS
jgi:hypothetical protein